MSDRKNVVQEMTLGAALAIIRNEREVSSVSGKASKKDQELLRRLRERRDFFNRNPEERKRQLNSLTKKCCGDRESGLSRNNDYFVAQLLTSSKATDKQNCDLLAVHLNNCYKCFIIYSDVLRDFYHYTQGKLSLKSNKKNRKEN
ncbi:MAG: hypothetical protein ACE5IR_20340 [bacterium]